MVSTPPPPFPPPPTACQGLSLGGADSPSLSGASKNALRQSSRCGQLQQGWVCPEMAGARGVGWTRVASATVMKAFPNQISHWPSNWANIGGACLLDGEFPCAISTGDHLRAQRPAEPSPTGIPKASDAEFKGLPKTHQSSEIIFQKLKHIKKKSVGTSYQKS